MRYKRCLIKISGESLGGQNENYNVGFIENLAEQIIKLRKEKVEIAIVVGAGNIWRGNRSNELNLDKVTGDYMGMIATIMNALVLEKNLNNLAKECAIIQSRLSVGNIVQAYDYKHVRKLLSNGKIVILAAGTGLPYFTTDTAAVLGAIEVAADVILMGKHGTDGVYDADPKQNPYAKYYSKITYKEIQEQKLEVIDLTASALALSGNIKTLVFDINQKNSLYNILYGKVKHTLIY